MTGPTISSGFPARAKDTYQGIYGMEQGRVCGGRAGGRDGTYPMDFAMQPFEQVAPFVPSGTIRQHQSFQWEKYLDRWY